MIYFSTLMGTLAVLATATAVPAKLAGREVAASSLINRSTVSSLDAKATPSSLESKASSLVTTPVPSSVETRPTPSSLDNGASSLLTTPSGSSLNGTPTPSSSIPKASVSTSSAAATTPGNTVPPNPSGTPDPVPYPEVWLSTPEWTRPQSLDKAENKGWGGYQGPWKFVFTEDYKKEHFNVKIYSHDKKSKWDTVVGGGKEPKVDKLLDCTIELKDPPTTKVWGIDVNVATEAPWLQSTGNATFSTFGCKIVP